MRACSVVLFAVVLAGCVDPALDREESRRTLPAPTPQQAAALPVPPCALSSTPGELCSPAEPPPPEETPDPAPHEEIPQAPPDACPPGMVLVHGDSCLTVHQECLEWMDTELPLEARKRCARFAPSKCLGGRRHLRFCIDRLEQSKAPGDLPINDLSWTLAKEQCEAQDKRLCHEPEWTFACEGPEMNPYPYGFERDAKRCNHDRTDLVVKNKMKDNRHPANDHPTCVSPFGVQNMVGNVDEWVILEKGYPPMRSGLKGGWWLAGRNRCRPTTGGHDEFYHDTQTGFRCCKDAK
jgi:sulfatase modifying factor 1